MKNKSPVFTVFSHIIFIIVSICALLPFLMMIAVSFSNETIINDSGFSMIPVKIDLAAYKMLFSDFSLIGRAMVFTIIIAIVKPAIGCIIQSLLGFSLAQEDYRLKKPIMCVVLMTMLFSAGTIPTYVLYTSVYHLGNNPAVFLLTGLVGAWDVLLYRTFFKNIPRSLIEAADIDGASQIQIIWSVVLPMSKAIFGLQYFTHLIGVWNNYNISLLYITDQKYMLIQHVLQRILENATILKQAYVMSGNMSAEIPLTTMRYAICIVAIIPVFLLFPYIQKYFSKGIAIGAVKG